MIKVCFRRGHELEFLAEVESLDKAWDYMSEDLKAKDIHPPYYRAWDDEEKRTVDYGSYTCFYEFYF